MAPLTHDCVEAGSSSWIGRVDARVDPRIRGPAAAPGGPSARRPAPGEQRALSIASARAHSTDSHWRRVHHR